MTLKKEINKYIRKIRSLLFVQTKESKRFVREMEASISDYIEENGVTNMEEIREHFGAPEDIAKAFFVNTSLFDVKRRVRLKRIVTSVLLAAFLLWAVYLTILFIGGLQSTQGYMIDSGPYSPGEKPGIVIQDRLEAEQEPLIREVL